MGDQMARNTRREPNRLTAVTIKAARVGDELEDGGGLRCIVGEAGAARWVFRYTSPVVKVKRKRKDGTEVEVFQRRETGLGWLGLKEARAAADKLREAVKGGHDPLHDAEQEARRERDKLADLERATVRDEATLGAFASTYHHGIKGAFRSPKHRAQWLRSLERNIPAKLWNKALAEITPAELLDVLLPLQERIPETAKRLRMRLSAVFQDAMLRDLCDRDPAAALKQRMRSKRKVEHLRAMPYAQVPHLVAALRDSDRVGLEVRLCVLFALATAARGGEVRGARWSEIDLAAKTWIVPGARMKAGEAHRVALSDFALDLLREAEALRSDEPDSLVFPAPRNPHGALSDMSMSMALRRIETGRKRDDGKPETYGNTTTVHGLARSCFSSWANESARARPDVVEACLAHREGDKVRAAYNRATFEDERRALLARWGNFLTAVPQSNVVAFPKA